MKFRHYGLMCALLMASPAWPGSVGTLIDDSLLTSEVKAVLSDNPATKARQINVDTSRGIVQLNGFVESAGEKAQAEQLAGEVEGVVAIDNNLQVSAGARSMVSIADDGVLTTRVNAALLSDARVKAYKINVKTNKGVVSLGGFVGSAAEQNAAESKVLLPRSPASSRW